MGNFQIGLYLPATPTDPFNTQSALINPWITTESHTTLTWFSVPDARQAKFVSPLTQGDDVGGRPIVRGYSQMEWDYPYLRADGWYFLYALFRKAQLSAGSKLDHIYIQWPDPLSGINQQTSARWRAIKSVSRDVAVVREITLTFSHLGIDESSPLPVVYKVG